MLQKRKPQTGIQQKRTFQLETREINSDERSVVVSCSSETPVKRWGYTEILCHDPECIDLSRLKDLGIVLFNHNKDYVLGQPKDIKLDKSLKRTSSKIIFDDDDPTNLIYKKVESGTLRGISIGYQVDCWEEVSDGSMSSNGRFAGPCYVATKWTPYEISIVSIPADDSVGIGRELEDLDKLNVLEKNEREIQMTLEQLCRSLGLDYNSFIAKGLNDEQIREIVTSLQKRDATSTPPAPASTVDVEAEKQRAVEAERKRAAEITALCREFEINEEQESKFINENSSVDAVRSAVLEQVRTKMKPVNSSHTDIVVGESGQDKLRDAASDGLLLRSGIRIEKPADGANQFRGMSLRDLAIDCAERDGVAKAHRLDTFELFRTVLTPDSQLASIFTNTVNKSMANAYRSAVPTFTAWAGTGSNSDFKTVTHYQVSEAGDLEEMTQSGEFKHDEITDNGVSKRIKTFGKRFGFTRQAIINDDLDVITKIPQSYVRAALRGRNKLVYKTLADTSLNIYDGTALFTSGHKNLAGTNAAISTTSISAGRTAMRKQKNLRNKEVLNITPQFLIVPAALETIGAQFLNSIADIGASHAGVANVFQKSMSQIVDAELDSYSSTAWYLAANSADIDTIEVTYLNGNEIPTLESRIGFDFLGMDWRIFDDFGVTCTDFRGLYKNAGA